MITRACKLLSYLTCGKHDPSRIAFSPADFVSKRKRETESIEVARKIQDSLTILINGAALSPRWAEIHLSYQYENVKLPEEHKECSLQSAERGKIIFGHSQHVWHCIHVCNVQENFVASKGLRILWGSDVRVMESNKCIVMFDLNEAWLTMIYLPM